MLLAIIGLPCSGKTTALDVCKKLGARTLASGDVIRDEIKRRGLEYNEKTDREMAAWFHEKDHEKVLVNRVLEKLGPYTKDDFIAIDGFRAVVQIEELEKQTGMKPLVIALEAPFTDRFVRCAKRHRFTNEDKAYLKSRDAVEKERGLGKLLETAGMKFDTTGMDETTFRREFEKFLREKVLG